MENNAVPNDYEGLLAEYKKIMNENGRKNSSGSKFVSRMNYDFNTLLNSVTGYMYAAYENADPAQKPAINSALKTSKLLLGKFDEMTDYLSLVFGGYKSKLTPSSIRLLLRQLNQEFDDALSTKSLHFNYELDERIPEYVETDFSVIKRALSRLIENAVQYTPSGEVAVRVSLISEKKDILTLKFEVSDEGEGAPVDKINAILRAGVTDSDGFEGVGLQVAGDFLSLVDAEISAEENEERGMTFSFTLEVTNVAAGAAADEPPIEPETGGKLLHGVNVLLADDSVIMQQIVKQMLESEGALVTVASNGEEAVELFRSKNPAVTLMDIEMPVLNGYGAARQINAIKQETGDTSPVIGMTAHTGTEEYDRCIESGMQRVVIKPFKYNDLMDAIFWELFDRKYVAVQTEEPEQKSSIYNFEKVKGIDYVEGVKRLGGNGKVYFELLQNFRDGYSDVAANITNLLKEGHDNEVLNLLHMMKGISGNLSFNEVYDYSNRLKEAIEQDNIMDITKYLMLFGKSIDEFVVSFEAAEVEILYNMSELVDMDLYLVKTRMSELMEYLTKDIDLGNAVDACDDIYDYIKEPSEKKEFERIRDAVHSFNLELAAELLKSYNAKYL